MTILHPDTGILIVIERDESGWYVSEVPELPGCVSQGKNVDEAFENICSALDDVLEVLQVDDPDHYERLTTVTGVGSITESDQTRSFDLPWISVAV